MRNNVVIAIETDSYNHIYKNLDLSDGVSISLEYRSNMTSSIDKITCSNSYTVKVPHTLNNDNILNLAKVPSHYNTQLYKKIPARIYVNGIDMTGDAWCHITDCDNDGYSLVFTFGTMQNLETWLTNKPSLRDLNPNNVMFGLSEPSKEGIDWDYAAGVSVWENEFPSKYANNLCSMYFGTYNCGADNLQLCNIHPWVSLREIWERIMSENGISIAVESVIKSQMEKIGLLLTSNNSKNLTAYVRNIASERMQQVGWIPDVVQYIALRFTENDSFHNTTPEYTTLALSPTRYTSRERWNEFGFLYNSDGSATIGAKRIYVGGLHGQGDQELINRETQYYTYFATYPVADMKMYYPLSTGEYQAVTAQRDSGMNCVYFDIPQIAADGSRPIIGSLIFEFKYLDSHGKWCQFDHSFIVVADNQYDASHETNRPFNMSYYYQQAGNAYNTGGMFYLVENLPDISQIDFVKAVCNLFGLCCIVNSSGNLELVNFSKLKDNVANSCDWTDKLIDTGRPSPNKISFTFNDYARKNSFGYREDEKDIKPHRSVDYLRVNNDMLEKEKKLIEFPWAASSVSIVGGIPYIPQYYFNEDNELQFNELQYRLLQQTGIPAANATVSNQNSNDRATPPASISLSFPEWLEASALLKSYYTYYQNAIIQPKVLTENMVLNEADLKNLDFTRPIYLKKYGRYFALISARWSSNNRMSEVKLLLLN